MTRLILLLFGCVLLGACHQKNFDLTAKKAAQPPIIDGIGQDACWENAKWYPLNQRWLGPEFNTEDFEGRYKLSWDASKLYLLVDIKDDILTDTHPEWDQNWWDDDCVEIFLDEDDGNDLHQFNHKAFAYHVALNGKDVVDLGPDQKPHLYNHHLIAARKTQGNASVWEFAIDIYSDGYLDGQENTPVVLSKNKKMGFALAYCDNDTSKTRENFIGSIPVSGETDQERDQGWKDAGIFNTLWLED